MRALDIRSAKKVVPIIYAYTTPEVKRHDGWTKSKIEFIESYVKEMR